MSVGATRRQIQMMFFLETALIVFTSGALGMGFALAVCHFVNKLPMPQYFAGLIPSWEVGGACVALLGLTAFLSALYPASRAAGIDPVQALHFEAGG